MADETALPQWNPIEDVFTFDQDARSHIPRAWERAPRSPFGGKHGGRKVWKRYETNPKEPEDTSQRDFQPAEPRPVLGDATNISKSVKRLRVKDALESPPGGKENKPSKYLATLRDKVQDTPKRKKASRKSPKPDRTRIETQEKEVSPTAVPVTTLNEIEDDLLQASQSSVQEDVRELLNPVDQDNPSVNNDGTTRHIDNINEEAIQCNSTLSSLSEQSREETIDLGCAKDVTRVEETMELPTQVSETENDSELLHSNAEKPISPVKPPPKASISSVKGNSSSPEPVVPLLDLETSQPTAKTPESNTLSKRLSSKQLHDVLSPAGSPQIGTSLLRRESLRRKESPSTGRRSRKSRTPRKKTTLSRRDTLQEREILQKVIAETSQDQTTEDLSHQDPQPLEGTTLPLSAFVAAEGQDAKSNDENTTLDDNKNEDPATVAESVGPEQRSPNTDDALVEENPHLVDRASQMHGEPNELDEVRFAAPTNEIAQINATEIINQVTENVDKDFAQISEPFKKQEEVPQRKTRSSARFSDDTSMLRDFLNRAQASKAAKTPVIPPLDAAKPQLSPRRSPRKAHGAPKSPIISPQYPEDITNRAHTPTKKSKIDRAELVDAEDITATPTSCRRSTRTKLPAPAKTPPGAPSFIPVRRADGTDPVVLQKSQAQELAMATRANTRRNKGQSKPPVLALKELPADTADVAEAARQRAQNEKSVGWAAQLASYQDSREKADEVEEAKPRVRRMRGLGAGIGTPATKKTTEKTTETVSTSNGTPAPKRRSKVR